jgi:2-amino-4-hydroxy-6-hydroxymethyldihydropteridine diphosphokinase
MKHTVYISIGSNLGDRLDNCAKAVEHLKRHQDIEVAAVSEWYETEAITLERERQPSYINGAVKITTSLTPQQLLAILKGTEREMGRPPHHPKWSSRTIDLDILFYDDLVINNNDLKPLKKSSLGVIASEAKQSHGIAAAPSGPRNDFFRGFDLIIPHPEIEKRMFVLQPLCDIAPELLHPVLKMKIKDLYLNIG